LKQNFLGLGFAVGYVVMGACLCDFMADITWPWVPTQQAFFWLKIFLESRLPSESLEPLISFYMRSPNYSPKTKTW